MQKVRQPQQEHFCILSGYLCLYSRIQFVIVYVLRCLRTTRYNFGCSSVDVMDIFPRFMVVE